MDIDEINAELETIRREEIERYIAELDVTLIADLEESYAAQ